MRGGFINMSPIVLSLLQGNNTSHQWNDGSPYTFQMWEQRFNNSAKVCTYLVEKGYRHTMLKRNYVVYIQPFSVIIHACTAAVYNANGAIKWMKIPCAGVHHGSSYICEIRFHHKINKTIFQHWLRRQTGIAVECPIGTFKLLDTCIGFCTYGLWTPDNWKDRCTNKGGKIYTIPDIILSKDLSFYTDHEKLFANVLQTMNHRWYGLSEHSTMAVDKIIKEHQGTSHICASIFADQLFTYGDFGFQHWRTQWSFTCGL